MHVIEIAARTSVRMNATVAAKTGIHRWRMNLVAADDPNWLRATYGSSIGLDSRDQRVEIPAQDRACRLRISAEHWDREGGSWSAGECVVEVNSVDDLQLRFGHPLRQPEEVLLSFVFTHDQGR